MLKGLPAVAGAFAIELDGLDCRPVAPYHLVAFGHMPAEEAPLVALDTAEEQTDHKAPVGPMDDGHADLAVARTDSGLDGCMAVVAVSHRMYGAAVFVVNVATVRPGGPAFGILGLPWVVCVQYWCSLPVEGHTVHAAMLEVVVETHEFPVWYKHFAHSLEVVHVYVEAQSEEGSLVLQFDLRYTWSQGVLLGPVGSRIRPVLLREAEEQHGHIAAMLLALHSLPVVFVG